MSTVQAQYYEGELDGKKIEEKIISDKVFLNPDILEMMFKYLDFFRLKLCRTVCKSWNAEICRGLRNRTVSYLQTEKDLSTFQTVLNNRGELSELIHSLSIILRNNNMLHQVLAVPVLITKLQVSEGMDCHHSATTRNLHSLLLRCSSTLTSLKIPFCDIGDAPELQGTCEELKFPLLEELNLTMWKQNLFPDHPEIPQGMMMLVGFPVIYSKTNRAYAFFSTLTRSAPKLCGIEIRWYSGPQRGIEKILQKLNLEKMTSVKIWTASFLNDACQALTQIQFENLKSLSLHTTCGDFECLLQNLLPTLQSTAATLETLSLDSHYQNLYLHLQLPAVKTYEVRSFSPRSWHSMRCFPNLTTVRIHRIHSVIHRTLRTCPETVKRVEIGFGRDLPEAKKSLWSLFHFFTPRASAWELPCEYVETFCDFIAGEREGRGVESVKIGSMPRVSLRLKNEYPSGFDFHWPSLTKGLESTQHLLDLKELTIINNVSGFSSSSWNSLSPQIFHRLDTFIYFSSIRFAELPEMASKLKLVRKVVLLGNRPVRLDAKAEQIFSTLPNAEVRCE